MILLYILLSIIAIIVSCSNWYNGFEYPKWWRFYIGLGFFMLGFNFFMNIASTKNSCKKVNSWYAFLYAFLSAFMLILILGALEFFRVSLPFYKDWCVWDELTKQQYNVAFFLSGFQSWLIIFSYFNVVNKSCKLSKEQLDEYREKKFRELDEEVNDSITMVNVE